MAELPLVSAAMPGPELSVALHTAANVLEAGAQRALSAPVFGIGTRFRFTAGALRRCAELLLDAEADTVPSEEPEIMQARDGLVALVRFTPWEEDRLYAYWAALGLFLNEHARAASAWPSTPNRLNEQASEGDLCA